MRACTEETTRKVKNHRAQGTLRATGKNAEVSVLKRTGTCSRMRARSEAEARYIRRTQEKLVLVVAACALVVATADLAVSWLAVV